jgi:membrane-associated two-gene conflict system component 1 (EACC1)
MVDIVTRMTFVSLSVVGHPEEVDHEVRALYQELRGIDAESVDFAAGGPPPEDAKAVDPATVTTIVVALAGSPALRQLGLVLQDWVNRDRHRKIVAKKGDRSIEITGSLDDAGQRAIEGFFDGED